MAAPRSKFGGSLVGRSRYFALIGLLALIALGGGGARADILSLLYLRPALALGLALFAILPGEWDWRGLKAPLILLGALALVIVIQLIPLPPGLWEALPGHAALSQAPELAGVGNPWRPLSMTPDLTRNSLVALLPALVMLVGFAGITEEQRRSLMPVLLAIMGVSIMLGVLQITGGQTSPAYLYKVTVRDVPVGLFSNRNHQAAFLACGFPLLRAWSMLRAESPRKQRTRELLAIGLGLALVIMILVVGSRAGLGLAAFGLFASALLTPPARAADGSRRRVVTLLAGMAVAAAAMLALAVMFGRATAVDRLLNADLNQEQRLEAFPVMLRMTTDFIPWGTGFGSFDPVFRTYEPDSQLSFFYFNHAHNDWLELLLTGGIPAVLVLVAFLAWFAFCAVKAFLPWRNKSQGVLYARVGAVMVMIFGLASFVDYPLRTPLAGSVFAIACAWLATMGTPRPAAPDSAGQLP